MKCVCGYEYETEYNDDGRNVVVKGCKPFKEHHITVYDGTEPSVVYLYACPKCNTVKLKPYRVLQ